MPKNKKSAGGTAIPSAEKQKLNAILNQRRENVNMRSIKVVVKRPNSTSTIEAMPNNLNGIYAAVGCEFFEVCHNLPQILRSRNIVALIDEEGKLNGSLFNFDIPNDKIFGNAVFVKVDGEDFASLSADDVMLVRSWLLKVTGV